MNPIFT